MKSPLWTVDQVADYLGCATKTIYRLAKSIPGYIKIGGNIRFNSETLIEWAKGKPPAESRAVALRKTSNPHDL